MSTAPARAASDSAAAPSAFEPGRAASPAPDTLIDLRGASRVYRMGEVEVRALDAVDLRVGRGEFVAITGASGSGKSTLLDLLGCLDQPTSGEYFLGGRGVGSLEPEELAGIRNATVGFVFQSFHLLARTSALENVELPLLYRRPSVPARRRRELALAALERAGLVGHDSSLPSQLSGGEQQRVAIARAIVTDPQILLADEPTGNLDAKAAEGIMAVLQDLNRSGHTILVVTHEAAIADCARRVVRMRDGRIVADEAVAQRPATSASEEGGAARRTRHEGRLSRIAERLPISIQALLRHRMRSFLTMLGVIIGVASILAMLALGSGASSSVQGAIASLGTDLIVVFPGAVTQSGARLFTDQSYLTADDAEAIARECESVGAVTPVVATSGQIVAGETNWGTSIQGVGGQWPAIRTWSLAAGAFFTDADVTRNARVCVLGATVAENLFPAGTAVGQSVRIRKVPFQVVGVLERKGSNLMGRDQDDVVLAPYTTAMKQLIGTTKVRFIFVSARSDREIQKTRDEITLLMRQRHRIRPGQDDDFSLTSQEEISSRAQETSRTLSLLLACVAAIALVVGGIGIMNIMLVSVTERTREIGLRLAVGARPGQLMRQFVAEALTLAMAGGVLGVLLGVVASALLSRIEGWTTSVTAASIALGFGSAAAIGVLSGLYPARRASRLDPIRALRFE